MKIYRIQTIFSGYKLGFVDESMKNGKYFAVPNHFLPCKVQIENDVVILLPEDDFVMEKTFDDKFREGQTYTLRYYKLDVFFNKLKKLQGLGIDLNN